MEKYNGEEYWEHLKSLGRIGLMKECAKMKKQLCKLSEIGDIDDVADALQENTNLRVSRDSKEKEINDAKRVIVSLLKDIGVSVNSGNRLDQKIIYLANAIRENI